MKISLAPLQGFTEYPFRNALAKTMGGVDKFYSPFVRFENDGSIRNKHIKDILPENNKNTPLIPQILVNNTEHFLQLAQIIEDYGYQEVNWNLGCPFPMVAKRKLGSGLLEFPDQINQILNEVIPKTNLNISIKLRSGYTNDSDISKVIEVLNHFPLSEIIYHPRIGKQLYKGIADTHKFNEIHKLSTTTMAYNGDIDSLETFDSLTALFPAVSHFMIGRGLIANPFLASEIKAGKPLDESEKRNQFSAFHQELFIHFSTALSGDSHFLNKFNHYWEYFSQLFEDSKRIYKSIKKCKTLDQLNTTTHTIIQNTKFK